MRRMTAFVSALLFAAPLSAHAHHLDSHFDLYYISSGLDITEPDEATFDDSGDGFGARGELLLVPGLFISGEYQSTRYDDIKADFDQLRFGIGGRAPLGRDLWGHLHAEYINIDYGESTSDFSDDFADGIGVRAGIQFDADFWSVYGSFGYLTLDGFDGPEFLIGAAIEFMPSLSVFADYRLTSLEADDGSGLEFEIDDFRAGVRFSF